jgi:hypothetical protein
MTRTERLTAYLTETGRLHDTTETAYVIGKILAIADDRQLMGPNEIQEYTRRSKTTVQSWYRRGSHHFPAAGWTLSAGPVWDAAVVKAWALRHPEALGPGSAALADWIKAQK